MEDAAYKALNETLIDTKYEIRGIRVPILRARAKAIIQQQQVETFLQQPLHYFEDVQLRAFVIAGCPVDVDARLALIEQFLPLADNWAVIDGLCSSLKEAKKEHATYWAWLQTLWKQHAPFTRRFIIVMYLTYFLTDEYIDDVLLQLQQQTMDHYYVNMAVAWALCEAFIKQRNKTLTLLQTTTMPTWTYNKALQKIRESLRVNEQDRELVKQLKR